MKEYKILKGIKVICCEYCCWHDVNIGCEYIFGHPETLSDYFEDEIYEKFPDEKWNINDIKNGKIKINNFDEIMEEIVNKFECSSCDVKIDEFLCLVEDGKVKKIYMEIYNSPLYYQ